MKRLIGPLLVAIVFSALLVMPQQAQAQTATTCMGRKVTIDMTTGASGIGTNGADVILGTGGADIIDGRGGNDTICGRAGNDLITGGDGNDTLLGQGGNDVVRGNGGNDAIAGGIGKDRLLGGTGADELDGGDGDDYIGGFGGADTIDGGSGNDKIFGGFGSDTIEGGPGNDIINGLIGNDTITGGDGNDVINGDRGNDVIKGDGGNDTITGGNADDILHGGGGSDNVSGGKADDWMSGGGGSDMCAGNRHHVADSTDGTCESTFGVEATSSGAPGTVPPAATPTPKPAAPPAPTPTPQPDTPPAPTPTPKPDTPPAPTPTPKPDTPPAPTPTPRPSIGTVAFVETFDEPSSLNRFDWAIHHGWQANATDQTWPGDHGLDCGPPEESRVIHNLAKINDGVFYYRDTFHESAYWCRGHLMTSLNTNHYAQVDFAPQQVFTDVSRVCWDQTRTDLGGRQWTQMVVVPLDIFEANDSRMDYVSRRLPTNPGPGTKSLKVTGDTLLVAINRGGTQVQTGSSWDSNNTGGSWRTSDRRTRYTICVEDQNNGTVRVELDHDTGVHVRILDGSMPDGPARVIFQDDTYNADKDMGVPDAYTWHWDNIIVETD